MNHTTDKYMNKGSKSRLNFYQKPALQQEYLSHHHVLPCLVTLWRSAILHQSTLPWICSLSELGFFISEGGCELLHRIKWQTQSGRTTCSDTGTGPVWTSLAVASGCWKSCIWNMGVLRLSRAFAPAALDLVWKMEHHHSPPCTLSSDGAWTRHTALWEVSFWYR